MGSVRVWRGGLGLGGGGEGEAEAGRGRGRVRVRQGGLLASFSFEAKWGITSDYQLITIVRITYGLRSDYGLRLRIVYYMGLSVDNNCSGYVFDVIVRVSPGCTIGSGPHST